jgi:hypothetical protein
MYRTALDHTGKLLGVTRVVRLDLAPSLSTPERLDTVFARAKELDDGSGLGVAGIVEFPLRGDGSVLMRLDRADLFLHDQLTAAVAHEELKALRQWMRRQLARSLAPRAHLVQVEDHWKIEITKPSQERRFEVEAALSILAAIDAAPDISRHALTQFHELVDVSF